ncbi:MAG TPA: carboxypeptidase-like regulatory domain-containing protein, partial [Vicinamibacteria bacterium]|nr:carboxypeptidase-like regulatory domain-containing protein [Vicinamibacteria bacterium]
TNVDAGSEDLQLVLAPGGTLTGIVADPEGRPLDTFRVDPQSLDGESDRFGHAHFIDVASSDGRFTFEGLPEGTYSVRAEAPEWAPGDVSNLEVSGGRTTDAGVIRLGRGGIVRGVAVDGGGAAVAGATVSVGPSGIWGGRRDAETQSAVDGRFEIRGLAPGRVVVRATHPAYATGVKTGVDVDPGKEPADVKLVLSAGGRIQGVAKMRDGTPLAGANVWVTPERLTEEAPFLHDGGGHARVEADGSFLVERLPDGPVTVRLGSPRDGPFVGDLEQVVRVVEGETTTVAFIVREILVTGRVTRAGAGVPKVRVTVNAGEMPGAPYVPPAPPAGVGPQPLTGVTRDDGSYELLVFETGPSTGLVSSLDGAVRYAARQGTVPDADRFELDFTLRGVPVTGVVVDKDTGEVLEHAQVGLRTTEGQEGGNARSGPDGRFSLEVEPGDYVFAVGVDGYAFVEGERNVGPAGLVDWRVEMVRGQKLHGRVVDAAGRAASGVPLLALGTGLMGVFDFTVSREDGRFRFDRLQAKPCDVVAASPLGFAVRRDVSPGETDVVLTLSPAGRIRLTIVDAQGAPVTGARARVAALDGRPLVLPVNTAVSDPAGALDLAAPAGSVEVEAEKDGHGGTITVAVEGGATAAARVVLGAASGKP